jgi:Fic family protein
MKLEAFKSGVLKSQHKDKKYNYKSFSPTFINKEWIWDDSLVNTLLEEATRQLGELNSFSKFVPNIDIFIAMHVKREANSSSGIEGTKTEMDDVVVDVKDVDPEKRDDWKEVMNYIFSMDYAIKKLQKLPISSRLLKKAHEILLSGVRGKNKTPGEFRISQNRIGGTNLQNALFIPPHHNEVEDLMSDLEKFIHNNKINVPHLIKIALIHYQFETIHPFQDGNGRTGRLLITLYFISFGLLEKPILYLSDFFERNKGSYYDSLTVARSSNDIIQWIKFFLTSIIETSIKAKNTLKKILELKEKTHSKILSLGRRAKNAEIAINYMYSRPIFKVEDIAKELDANHNVANALIKELVRLKILKEITGYRKHRLFVFKEYFDLFKNGD